MRRGDGQRGQAALELLAALPLVLLAGLLAWQLVAVLGAGMSAQAEARSAALQRAGAASGLTVITETVAVPAVLPGVRGLRVRATAAVVTP